ncbi:hypothetical protein PRZ48_000170 [Zasmidium cellare]|uniref:Arylsulfotransferase n=1 Tax=Zasmidium cellare TaxID=395010 RepID=A0ABR0F033_ZASCE|nr:hypothetical protein PRZ48_000170 [Zasmidium cellare]
MRLRPSNPPSFLYFFIFFFLPIQAAGSDIIRGSSNSYPTHTFYSSKVKAPIIDFQTRSPACNDGGHYFITPRGWKVPSPGPMILDGDGNLIWTNHFSNKFGGQAYDLRVQKYKGEEFLTFWLGDDRVRGHGAGHYYMLNSSYDVVHKVGAANGRFADLHEFTITPEGTALLIIFEAAQADVRPVGRKFSDVWNQAAYDCLFQEVNIETGQAIFEWRASEHVNMTHAYNRIEGLDQGTREKPFDFIHLNSVDKDDSGNYLISGRNTHSIIYIDGKTGEVLWTLGGKGNDFKDLSSGHVLNMAWQHDARFVPAAAFPKAYSPTKKKGMTTRLMTIFDNAALDWNYEYGPAYSRGLLVEVTFPTAKKSKRTKRHRDLEVLTRVDDRLSEKDAAKVEEITGKDEAYTVRIVREYIHPKHVRSSTQGSVQVLPQGKKEDSTLFVGYGINAVMTEFASNGTVLCDMHFGSDESWETGNVQSYRAYKFPWVGRPRHPPSVVVRKDVAYVSWNGATEVREWLLQVSDRLDGEWTEVVKVAKTGFETAISLKTTEYQASGRYVRVLAIDDTGRICEHGESAAADRSFAGKIPGLGKLRVDNVRLSLLNFTIVGMASITVVAVFIRLLRRRRSSSRAKGAHVD